MMKTRIKRKCGWNRQGVSEVVGTILTLTITVVLFSSIIAMVDKFPAPNENMYTEFNATIDWSDWETQNISYIQITNIGGTTMSGLTCRVVLTIDSSTFTLSTKGTLGVTYGIGPIAFGHTGPDNGNDDWDTGETWVIGRYGPAEINRDSNVGVMIVDTGRNTVVWSGTIQGEQNQFGPVISDMWVDSNLGSTRRDPVDWGRPFYFFAFVRDTDGDLIQTSVFADLSSINQVNASWMFLQLSDPEGDGIFVSEALDGPTEGSIPIGYHVAIVSATDLANHTSSGIGRIPVGQDLGAQPNLVIGADDVKVSDQNPTNGQSISLTATVTNFGGNCVGIMNFYDIIGNVSTYIRSENFTIADAPDQVTKVISFKASGGGPHTLMVEAYPVNVTDADPQDNFNYTEMNVMPTILLVDDDNHPPDMSPYDTVSYMRAALDSCDFEYKLYTVSSNQNGPSYRLGEKESRMKTYDIVIWMCGYEKTNTLTRYDQENLTMFINDADGFGVNGGSLWLIGQYLLNDSNIPLNFFQDNLEMANRIGLADGPSTPMWGVNGHPISNEWNITFGLPIPIIIRASGEDQTYIISPDVAQGAEIVFNSGISSPGYGDAINYENQTTKARSVFFPWEYSRINSVADQAQVTYKVIMWLGNITKKFGRDVAISEQTTVPTYVFYNKDVNVTAIIRNNGAQPESDVEALLTVDGRPQTSNITTVTLSGFGGTATVSLNWKATSLGTHVLRWVADPNNHIPETNENNNMVPSYVHTGEVYVKFRILVVDDDESPNNGGPLANETKYATDSLARLNFEYEYNNSVNSTYVVNVGADGPNYDVLKDYSAVIWVTGSAPGGLTPYDNNSLVRYLANSYGRLWLIGEDLLDPSSNLTGILGIQSISPNQTFPGRLRGVDNSSISHGMDISALAGARGGILIPNADGNGVFYQDYSRNQNGNYTAISIDKAGYMALTCAFKFEALYGNDTTLVYGNNATDELTYMALHWMGKPETRKELRTTMVDITLSDMHPQIGSSYILRARVYNVGGQNASFLVRFMDGSTQIDSNSATASPDTMISVEVIWKPLYAGLRNISIYVDPVAEVSEIFDWFNNNVTFSVYVYYFWDDMENGTSKWTHASNIMNINGEGPLDYYGSETTLSTDIIDDWDWSMSVGLNKTTTTSYSYPSSYWLEEPAGTMVLKKADVLISFVIDDSASMTNRFATNGNTWLREAQNGAVALLDQLSNNSVCLSVWDFSAQKARRWWGPNDAPLWNTSANYNTNIIEPPVRLGDAYPPWGDGVDKMENVILSMSNTNGQTILWDAVGGAYEDIKWWSMQSQYANLTPVVIVLGDGADNQASDQSGFSEQGAEAGSGIWCPWDGMVNGSHMYGSSTGSNKPCHYGKYSHWSNPTASARWLETGDQGGSVDHTRVGVLHSDRMIFTIGLGLETHTPTPWAPQVISYPGDGTYDSANAFYLASSGGFYATYPEVYKESGTLEYNFWRIANTSGAQYFYAPSADELGGIFGEIAVLLASGGINQTRSSTPAPSVQAVLNYNKAAVTDSFNLSNLASAKLSFRQKYSMTSGCHGGFLQIGTKNATTGAWEWKYIVPYNSYTGNLKYDEFVYDTFGNRIFWCWNGLSGRGTFSWDYVYVDLLNYVPAQYRNNVRVKFNYTQFGQGTGYGWYLDDVKLVVSRDDNATLTNTTKDVWQRVNTESHSGSYSWWNRDNTTGFMKPGIDNYLMSSAIVLTSARTAYLSAYFRFNINDAPGSPPDGFRIEASTDNGVTWERLCNGVRAATAVSGTGPDSEDGIIDSKSYTGICDSGSYITDDYWVNANTLSRAIVDLSPYTGHSIHIRFRVVNNNLANLDYNHYKNNALFGGFFVDDVIVYGQTIAE